MWTEQAEEIIETDDMPLNENDRGWIKNAISEALRDQSKGWKEFVRLFSLPSVATGLLIFTWTQWDKYVEFRTHTNDTLASIDKRLADIDKSLLPLRAQALATSPPGPQNQAEARNILTAAKTKSISLPETAIERAGEKFIEASRSDPNAWGVALELVAYRSSQNIAASPPQGNSIPISGTSKYKQNPVNGSRTAEMIWIGPIVPNERAAHFDRIGVDANAGSPGPARLQLSGGAERLDGQEIRHVTFRGVEIHYSGEPLILEDVIFIDCTFVFDNNERGRKLGQSLLASASVNFQTAS